MKQLFTHPIMTSLHQKVSHHYERHLSWFINCLLNEIMFILDNSYQFYDNQPLLCKIR